jgi:hypothetical protein
MVNPKRKGKSGEDEACEWINKHIYDNRRRLTRNYNQAYVGVDILDYPFIYEVKRSERLSLDAWWIQVSKVQKRLKAHNKQTIPVVMFRQNNKPWEFLISADAIGGSTGWIRLTQNRFKEWASRYVEKASS